MMVCGKTIAEPIRKTQIAGGQLARGKEKEGEISTGYCLEQVWNGLPTKGATFEVAVIVQLTTSLTVTKGSNGPSQRIQVTRSYCCHEALTDWEIKTTTIVTFNAFGTVKTLTKRQTS